MTMKSSLLLPLVLVGLFLAGCTTTAVPPEARARIKRVAVVSDLAPEIRVHSMGFLPALQKDRAGQAEGFSVADFAEGVVADELTREGYVAGPVSAELRAAAREAIGAGFKKATLARLEPLVQDVDAVVFIVSQQNQGMYGGETGFGGIEVIPSKIFGMKAILIGCNTGLFIYATAPLRRVGVDVDARGGGEVRGTEWHDRWEDFPPADQQKIIQDLRTAIEAALRPKIAALL